MDQLVSKGLGKLGSLLTVITRSGKPSRVADLDLVGAGLAQRSILLRPEHIALNNVEEASHTLQLQVQLQVQLVQVNAVVLPACVL